MNKKIIRLGIAGAFGAFSMAGIAVPAHAHDISQSAPPVTTCPKAPAGPGAADGELKPLLKITEPVVTGITCT